MNTLRAHKSYHILISHQQILYDILVEIDLRSMITQLFCVGDGDNLVNRKFDTAYFTVCDKFGGLWNAD